MSTIGCSPIGGILSLVFVESTLLNEAGIVIRELEHALFYTKLLDTDAIVCLAMEQYLIYCTKR